MTVDQSHGITPFAPTTSNHWLYLIQQTSIQCGSGQDIQRINCSIDKINDVLISNMETIWTRGCVECPVAAPVIFQHPRDPHSAGAVGHDLGCMAKSSFPNSSGDNIGRNLATVGDEGRGWAGFVDEGGVAAVVVVLDSGGGEESICGFWVAGGEGSSFDGCEEDGKSDGAGGELHLALRYVRGSC